jgi:hypothetical protein
MLIMHAIDKGILFLTQIKVWQNNLMFSTAHACEENKRKKI